MYRTTVSIPKLTLQDRAYLQERFGLSVPQERLVHNLVEAYSVAFEQVNRSLPAYECVAKRPLLEEKLPEGGSVWDAHYGWLEAGKFHFSFVVFD